MSGKRTASNYLTDQNWDQEEEPEEAGQFEVANKDVLQKRKIKVAKRRNLNTDDGKGAQVFKGFSFGAGTVGAGSAPTISLGAFGTDSSKKDRVSKPSTDGQTKTLFNSSQSIKNGNQASKSNGSKSSGSNVKYLSSLKALNQGFRSWVCDHLEKNFLIDLTPVCNDYIKHMKVIEKENVEADKPEASSAPAEDDEVTFKKDLDVKETSPVKSVSPKEPDVKKPTFGSTAVPFTFTAKTQEETSKPTFSFGQSAKSTETVKPTPIFGSGTSSTETSKPTFAFGTSSAASETAKSGFSFGAGKAPADAAKSTFSFGSGTAPSFSFGATKTDDSSKVTFGFGAMPAGSGTAGSEAGASGGADDAEYVPPVADHKTVEEADSVLTQRCKLFYQKDGKWLDKGIGNLHLKPSSGKTQLLIRADTSLGNILLNIMLQSQMNFKMQGKNSITFLCMPNPPLDPKAAENESPKPTMMLLKVKTEDMATSLLEKLNELKG